MHLHDWEGESGAGVGIESEFDEWQQLQMSCWATFASSAQQSVQPREHLIGQLAIMNARIVLKISWFIKIQNIVGCYNSIVHINTQL